MTPRTARRTLATSLALAGIVGAAWIGHPGDAQELQASCTRDTAAKVWRCTFPTQGRDARVVVQAFEDGSANVAAYDPDTEIK